MLLSISLLALTPFVILIGQYEEIQEDIFSLRNGKFRAEMMIRLITAVMKLHSKICEDDKVSPVSC